MVDAVERRTVITKNPIFYGRDQERLVGGQPKCVQPFVELWLEHEIVGFTARRIWRPEVHFGLREFPSGVEYSGDNNFVEPDPLRLFRAVQILDRLNTIEPYVDLRDTYLATGVTGFLPVDRYARRKIQKMIGREAFQEISQSVPPNLAEIIRDMRKEKLAVDGTTLERDIKKGRIETQPLYDRVINETRRRQVRLEQELIRYQQDKYSGALA